MHKATPEELALRYVLGDLTDTQLNYWVKTRKLDSQEIENLIEYYQGGTRRTAAMSVLCLYFLFCMLPLLAALLSSFFD